MDESTAIAQLSDERVSLRLAAAQWLANDSNAARAAAIPLIAGAADESDEVREWVVEAIENMGPPDQGDLAEIAQMLTLDSDAAYWAATLLGRAGDACGEETVNRLARGLNQHPRQAVRARIAWALGRIPINAAAHQSLQQAASDDDPRTARLARRALNQ
ncbi:MAG: hypothetical protein QGG36_25220 [Pirellulaceae bacterium]|jgi:HEAT repeat protein|nr:hypothetical protein [Pirellulaceae bacterium]MDP7019123.1 hypothetical protein [Pirellulaceae bacterium]